MKAAGIIFILFGITGSAIFGINILNDSKIISFFGLNFTISPDNWTPFVISLLILIIGIILLSAVKKAEKNPQQSHISGERQQ